MLKAHAFEKITSGGIAELPQVTSAELNAFKHMLVRQIYIQRNRRIATDDIS